MPISDKLTLDISPFLSEIKKADAAGVALSKKLDVKSTVDFNIDKSALGEVDKIKKEIGAPVEVPVKADVDSKPLAGLNNEVDKLKGAVGSGGGLLGSFGGGLAALVSPAGLATAALGGLTFAAFKVFDAFNVQDTTLTNLENGFRLAGLAGDAVAGAMDAAEASARKLGNQLGQPIDKIKNLSAQAAALGGVTGKTNEDLTKVALGIEAATQGSVDGAAAIKIFTRGLADPENAEAIDRLTKQFPKLGAVLEGVGTPAEKLDAAIKALSPTFDVMTADAKDVVAQFGILQDNIGETVRQFAGGLIGAIDVGVFTAGLGDAFNFEEIAKGAKELGVQIGGAIQGVLSAIAPVFSLVSKNFIDAFKSLSDVLKPILAGIGAVIGGAFLSNILVVSAAWSALSSTISAVAKGISEAVAPIFSKLASLFGATGGEALTLSGVMDKFGKVLNFVAGVASEFGKLVGEVLVTGFQILYGVISGVVTVIADIVGWFSKLSGETKESGENAKESGGFFAKLGNIFENLQFYIAGAVSGFREIKTVIGEVGEAVFSLDFSKVFDLLSNFGGRVSESAKKGFDAAKKTSIEANKLAEETAKKNEEIAKAEADAKKAGETEEARKKAAESAKKRFDAIKLELDTQKKINGRKIDALKLSIEQEAAEQGRKVTGEEQAKILQLENKLTDDLLKKSRELFRVSGEGEDIKVGVSLGDNKEAAKDIIFGLQSEFDRSNLSLKKLGFVDEPAKFKERIEESIRGLSDLEIETKVRFGVTELDAVADYKSALNKLAQEESEARARANTSTDKEQVKFFIELAEKTKKARIDGEKRLTGELQKIQEQRRAAFISGIEDDVEREIETKILGLEKQRDAELSNVFLTETQKAVIVERFEKQINELRNKGAFDYLGTWQNVMTGISSAFAGQTEEQKKSFEEAKKTLDQVNAAGSERLQQIDDEIRLTLKQGKTGTLSYNQQAEKIKELEEKRQQAQEETAKSIADANAKLEENTTSVLGRVRNSFVKSFDEISKTTTAKLNEVGANIGTALLKVGSDFSNFEAVGAVVMENLGAAAGVAALSLGSAFGTALASGTLSLKSFAQLSLGIVFDTIQAAVNAYAAQIFAVNAAALPFGLGIPGALGLIATVNALLAAARAGIGAEDGVVGIDGNYSKKAGRTDTIPILVAPNESIITAKATAKHYKLLDAINNDRNILGAIRDSLTTNELKQLAATYYTPSERGELGLNNNRTGSGGHSYRDETFNINAKLVASGDDLTAIFNRRTKRKIRGL